MYSNYNLHLWMWMFRLRSHCPLQSAVLHAPHLHPVLQGDSLRLEGRRGDQTHKPQPTVEANLGQIRMLGRVLQSFKEMLKINSRRCEFYW